jgi:uncharacterized membrane protein
MKIPFMSALSARIRDHSIRVRASYWFLPSLMTVGALCLALGLVGVDRAVPDWAAGLPFVVASQPEGARGLLAAVAGSMITVAGVTFSMMLVMLSFASAQLGTRLVPRFLRDRGNQIVLGMFIATFIYCLIVLRTVRSPAESEMPGAETAFVPHLAILVAVVLALLSVAVLIYFLHHVPSSMNAGSVISLLGDELVQRVEHDFPPADGGRGALHWPVDRDAGGDVISLTGAGCYLRIVDYDALAALAKRTDRRFTTLVAPGAFRVPGSPLVRVHGGPLDDACVRELRGLFSWGGDRTPDQDILFLVDQLAEIAGKALSPSMNGQFTALLCIDQIERVLSAAAQRREPDAVRTVDGVARLFVARPSLQNVADGFLVPLRQFARGDAMATNRLLAMLDGCLSRCVPGSPLHDTLRRHRDALRHGAPDTGSNTMSSVRS